MELLPQDDRRADSQRHGLTNGLGVNPPRAVGTAGRDKLTGMNNPDTFHIRGFRAVDLPELVAIENASDPHPWSRSNFVGQIGTKTFCRVVSAAGRTEVLGFIIWRRLVSRIVIMKLAVGPVHRRQRIGTLLLNDLKNGTLAPWMDMYLGETNLEGQLFARACGLRAIAIDGRAHPWTHEDIYRFRWSRCGDPGRLRIERTDRVLLAINSRPTDRLKGGPAFA